MDFRFVEPASCALIKVIGVGGGGCNAVQHMIEASKDMIGVEFISANTDIQSLSKNAATIKLQLGPRLTKGLGAGSLPDIGRDAALESRQDITELLKNCDMVFIAAGMGGGTGTGAAPIIAEIAKGLGILTVAVVTKPFSFEGKRNKVAQMGLQELAQHVNSLIVVPNDRLIPVLGKEVTVLEAFAAINRVLSNAVLGIAEIINKTGLINPDFNDVRTVMSETGMAIMGSAEASGEGCAAKAASAAVSSPLLGDVKLSNVRGILVNITTPIGFSLGELDEVMSTINACARDDATVIYGHVFDEMMEQNSLRVTVVATGLATEYVPSAHNHHSQGIRTRADDVSPHSPLPKDDPEMGSNRRTQVEAMEKAGDSTFDIPTFLRRQQDSKVDNQ